MDISRKYLPSPVELVGSGIHLSRLYRQEDGEPRKLFEALTTPVISGMYDEISASFASNITSIDAADHDPFGYFTLGKEVWVAREHFQGEVVGFEVMTRKRGGSVKLGPTLVLDKFHGRGISHRMISALEELYRSAGARKLYVTAPINHAPTVKLDFRHLRFSVEALLRDQYRVGSGERVFGRLLQRALENGIDADVEIKPDASADDISIDELSSVSEELVEHYLPAAMRYAYDDIDESFASAVTRAHYRGVGGAYEEKGKLVEVLIRKKEVVGVAICTPKRGGAVKLAPLLIDPEYRSAELVSRLLGQIRDKLAGIGKRKLFVPMPVADWNLCTMLFGQNFLLEGILRSPYKPGVDFMILSDFLTPPGCR